jgi:hypothetical protein
VPSPSAFDTLTIEMPTLIRPPHSFAGPPDLDKYGLPAAPRGGANVALFDARRIPRTGRMQRFVAKLTNAVAKVAALQEVALLRFVTISDTLFFRSHGLENKTFFVSRMCFTNCRAIRLYASITLRFVFTCCG